MPVTRYHQLNSELISETASGARTDYLSDGLGSVTSTVNASAQVVNSYVFEPSGSLLGKIGSGSDPRFLWVGTEGYRTTSRQHSESHVRARHYSQTEGAWSTVDPKWPNEKAYLYADANPTTLTDPLGLCASCCCKGINVGPPTAKTMEGEHLTLNKKNPNLYWGHHIEIPFETGSADDSPTSDCTLIWKECSNWPIPSGPANTWNTVIPKGVLGFDDWFNRKFDCGANSSSKGVLKDEPSLTKKRLQDVYKQLQDKYHDGRSAIRVLFIEVSIQGGNSCQSSNVVKMFQRIEYDGTKILTPVFLDSWPDPNRTYCKSP